MSNLQETVTTFAALVADFRYQEAHERFYHADLVKHENEGAPTIGLAKHKEEMKRFLASIKEPSATLLQCIVSDNMSVMDWHYQFHHAQWGYRDFRQLSIQRWRDGKIVHERHHYK